MKLSRFVSKNMVDKVLRFGSGRARICKMEELNSPKKPLKLLSVLAGIFVLFFPLSCHYLDFTNQSPWTEEMITKEYTLASVLLSAVYAYLPTDFMPIDGATRSSASDDAIHVTSLSSVYRFNDGSWSALNPIDDVWTNMYYGIRAANNFLRISKGLTFEENRYSSRTDYAGQMKRFYYFPYETRFLRAFYHFELIKRYHNVPLVTKELTPEEAMSYPTTSFDDMVKFIVTECDSASLKLPVTFKNVTGSETGRATKGAAQALKARVLLYAASPLNNPSNDIQKWINAAIAAKAIIDGGAYKLETNYAGVVNNYKTPVELIFETRQSAANTFERANFPVGYIGGNTGTCPTQNLVDSYEMAATGLGINEPGSGYNAANPYVGRDPRFAATILYNNSTWKGLPVQVWTGGVNGPPVFNASLTGYYLKKYVIEAVRLDPNLGITTAEHTWVNFRYGEVLLNYAEAMNEAYGPSATGPGTLSMNATQAVNQIRTRAKMPPFPAGMSQSEFRDKLRNERRVELAFEDHRFWDVRRWKIANTLTSIYGVDVVNNNNVYTYTRKLVEQRVWKPDNRMLWYPISQAEMYRNPKLVQNPGW
ncbi:MAG: RagB/SusD family nutrient uptake outer membrane protein [Prolixibacteraceae bacterium]|nr:RagB/SusD family nutrient uptake outer membrane protein [Prolixibacteraceae bacterium]